MPLPTPFSFSTTGLEGSHNSVDQQITEAFKSHLLVETLSNIEHLQTAILLRRINMRFETILLAAALITTAFAAPLNSSKSFVMQESERK